jgi:hypothetical protein
MKLEESKSANVVFNQSVPTDGPTPAGATAGPRLNLGVRQLEKETRQ